VVEALAFEAASHTYRFGGRVVPSVTQLLQHLHSFDFVDSAVLEAAQDRGSFVHEMCEAYDLGDLDEARLPDEYRGYLEGWKRFLATYEPDWTGIEERGFSRIHGFAGTLDRRGTFGRVLPGKAIADIKTAKQSHPVWGMQLAAYRQIVVERDLSWSLARRFTVQLQPTGVFNVIEWNNPIDWPAFQSLLTLLAWSKQ
jgi:hypothetical protein